MGRTTDAYLCFAVLLRLHKAYIYTRIIQNVSRYNQRKFKEVAFSHVYLSNFDFKVKNAQNN